jgi:small-conductance mechanosensitive channel
MFVQQVQDWMVVFTQSLQEIASGVASFIPAIIFAVVVFVIGWALAVLIERLIESVFKTIKIDSALKAAGVETIVSRAGYKLNSGLFVGALVKWFIIVVFLVASFDILGLSQVNSFLGIVVLSYLPNVIIAVLVLMVAIVVGDAVQKLVIASSRAAHLKSSAFLGKVAKWAIWIVAILTALSRLGLDSGPLNTIFIGIVAALSLALGLSFGLGCRDHAGKLVEKLARDVSEKE